MFNRGYASTDFVEDEDSEDLEYEVYEPYTQMNYDDQKENNLFSVGSDAKEGDIFIPFSVLNGRSNLKTLSEAELDEIYGDKPKSEQKEVVFSTEESKTFESTISSHYEGKGIVSNFDRDSSVCECIPYTSQEFKEDDMSGNLADIFLKNGKGQLLKLSLRFTSFHRKVCGSHSKMVVDNLQPFLFPNLYDLNEIYKDGFYKVSSYPRDFRNYFLSLCQREPKKPVRKNFRGLIEINRYPDNPSCMEIYILFQVCCCCHMDCSTCVAKPSSKVKKKLTTGR